MDAAGYVDDLLAALRAEDHGICAGIAGRCVQCLERFVEAGRREGRFCRLWTSFICPAQEKGGYDPSGIIYSGDL